MKTLKQEARELMENKLLTKILRDRKNELITAWRQCSDPEARDQYWHAQRQLDVLAGAIEDAIREHGGSRTDE